MRHRLVPSALALALGMLVFEEVIEAQTMTPPPRVTARAPEALQTRTVSSLKMDTALFGGFDQNLTELQRIPGVPIDKSNFTGQGTVGLRYSVGQGGRNFGLGGDGMLMSRSNVTGGQQAVYGFNADGSFATPMGSKTGLALSQTASRNPYYSQGVFGSLPPGTNYLPDASPVNGVFDGYLWRLSSTAGVTNTWSSRTTTGATLYHMRELHEGGRQQDTAYTINTGTANLLQQITQTVGLGFQYQIANRSGDQTGVTGLQYNDFTHTVTVRLSASKAISRSRTLSLDVSGGANQINSTNRHYWQPTYYGSVNVDIGRSWVASTTYYQTSYFLISPLSAPDSYLSQSLTVSTGGNVSRNIGLVFNVAASQGEVAAPNSVTGTSGDYTGFVTGAQISFGLPGGWSASTSANYYQSDLSGAAKQFALTTGAFQRASVWAGLSWNTMLHESPRAPRRGRGR
jgi:hypothetical protein